jgi:hypothetical protein
MTPLMLSQHGSDPSRMTAPLRNVSTPLPSSIGSPLGVGSVARRAQPSAPVQAPSAPAAPSDQVSLSSEARALLASRSPALEGPESNTLSLAAAPSRLSARAQAYAAQAAPVAEQSAGALTSSSASPVADSNEAGSTLTSSALGSPAANVAAPGARSSVESVNAIEAERPQPRARPRIGVDGLARAPFSAPPLRGAENVDAALMFIMAHHAGAQLGTSGSGGSENS